MSYLNRYSTEDVNKLRAACGRTSTVLSKLGHKGSVRARQRAIAFYLAVKNDCWNGHISPSELREWCKLLGAYNAPNFAQNMTKEAARGLLTGSVRSGWELTETGRAYAATLAADIDRTTAEIAQALAAIVVKAGTPPCALCGDDCAEGEHLMVCDCCGVAVHHECNEEMRNNGDDYSSRRDRRLQCPNRHLCRGAMVEHGTPAVAEEAPAETVAVSEPAEAPAVAEVEESAPALAEEPTAAPVRGPLVIRVTPIVAETVRDATAPAETTETRTTEAA